MNRYYVEFGSLGNGHTQLDYEYCLNKALSESPKGFYLYVYGYSQEHVRDMFQDYKLVAIDQTD